MAETGSEQVALEVPAKTTLEEDGFVGKKGNNVNSFWRSERAFDQVNPSVTPTMANDEGVIFFILAREEAYDISAHPRIVTESL